MSSAELNAFLPSPLEQLHLPHWPKSAPNVWVKRDDLIHPVISGNKWRKLKYSDLGQGKRIVSIGGGYSNHLHALGYLCRHHKKAFTALVRGHYQHSLTPMLKDLADWHSEIAFIDKKHYAQRESNDFKHWLNEKYPDCIYIPEGGSTFIALQGVADIQREIQAQLHNNVTHVIAPVASGATLAGLITGRQSDKQRVLGIAVLKGRAYLHQQVERFLTKKYSNWFINHDYVHGGYAKTSPELIQFINAFFTQTSIPIETVYSAKLFFALDQLVINNYFNASDEIVAIHTGGLQGARN